MATSTWKTGVSGDWGTASDWSSGLSPGGADTAVIGSGGTATAPWIVSASNDSVGSVLFDGGSFGTLSVTGSLAVSGSLSIGNGTLLAAPGSDITVGGDLTAAGPVLATSADISASLLTFSLGSGATFNGGTIQGNGLILDTNVSLTAGAIWNTGTIYIAAFNETRNSLPGELSLSNATLVATGRLFVGTADGTSLPQGSIVDVMSVTNGSSVAAPAGLEGLVIGSWDGGEITIDANSSVTVGTAAPVKGAVAVGGDGMIQAEVSSTIVGNVVNNGSISVEQLTVNGGVSGSGAIGDSGTLEVGSLSAFTGTITLYGRPGADASAGFLIIDTGDAPAARLEFSQYGTIQLNSLPYANQTPLYNSTTGLLTVGSDTLDVGTGFNASAFHTARGLHGDSATRVFVNTHPCYVLGTRIATPSGERAVEALQPGDPVLTLGGTVRPVRWMGRFGVDLDRHPTPDTAAPVRIVAHAFAGNVPHRDLLVSPDHAVFIDGVLMQAQALVNGATIVREPARGCITYLHVELDRHALLLAEGLPAESYLDTGNRGWFTAEAGMRPLFPDFSARTWAADACAPLVLDGAELEAAHSWLLARAEMLGWGLTTDAALTIEADGALLPLQTDGALGWQATLPQGTATMRLRSRSFVPAELDKLSTDRRRLGLAITALTGAAFTYGRGWHEPEPGWRWTDGDAALTLVPPPHTITLRIAATGAGGRYWRGPSPSPVPSRKGRGDSCDSPAGLPRAAARR